VRRRPGLLGSSAGSRTSRRPGRSAAGIPRRTFRWAAGHASARRRPRTRPRRLRRAASAAGAIRRCDPSRAPARTAGGAVLPDDSRGVVPGRRQARRSPGRGSCARHPRTADGGRSCNRPRRVRFPRHWLLQHWLLQHWPSAGGHRGGRSVRRPLSCRFASRPSVPRRWARLRGQARWRMSPPGTVPSRDSGPTARRPRNLRRSSLASGARRRPAACAAAVAAATSPPMHCGRTRPGCYVPTAAPSAGRAGRGSSSGTCGGSQARL
jgi:hypothetical protein